MAADPDQTREPIQVGDQKVTRGHGGEYHQAADGDTPVLTTNQGVPVSDDQNSLKIGERGPTAARGLPLPREDLPLRSRTHPRARGARARHGRARLLRDLRIAVRHHPRRPVPAQGREDRSVRAVLDRGGQQGLGRPRARRARLRGQALHQGGQLGPRRQQHPGVLHPGRDQVPGPDPRRQAGARPRLPAGADRARHVLGLHLADPGKHEHGHVDHVGPDDPALVPLHGGVRRPHLPAASTPRASRPSSSSTGSPRWACSRWSGTRR